MRFLLNPQMRCTFPTKVRGGTLDGCVCVWGRLVKTTGGSASGSDTIGANAVHIFVPLPIEYIVPQYFCAAGGGRTNDVDASSGTTNGLGGDGGVLGRDCEGRKSPFRRREGRLTTRREAGRMVVNSSAFLRLGLGLHDTYSSPRLLLHCVQLHVLSQ